MEFRVLRYFLTVARDGSITGAAWHPFGYYQFCNS
ncbi:LysR family transcriptional regulator [Bacillus sp. FSL K6-3431]